jgi:hypothetical protein
VLLELRGAAFEFVSKIVMYEGNGGCEIHTADIMRIVRYYGNLLDTLRSI